jgi:hypothetical protein
VSEGEAIGLQPNEAAKNLQAHYALRFAGQPRASAPCLRVSSLAGSMGRRSAGMI